MPRAVDRSPRSKMWIQPKLRNSSDTGAFASMLFELTKTWWSPFATSGGWVMTRAVTVFSVFTTRVSGKARWICSVSESLPKTVN